MGKFLNRNQRHNFFDNNDNLDNENNIAEENTVDPFNSEPDNNSFNAFNNENAFDNNMAFGTMGGGKTVYYDNESSNDTTTVDDNNSNTENANEISEELEENTINSIDETPTDNENSEILNNLSSNSLDNNSSNIIDDNSEKNSDIMKVLKIEDIYILPNNPFVTKDNSGNDIDDIVSLANDIKENGLIHPITVTVNSENKYELVSGERRLKALKFLNRTEVPAYIREFKSEEDKTLAVFAANLATRQYSPLTKINLIAEYYKQLLLANKNDINASANARKKISELLHISTAQIQKYISIVKKLKNVPKDILSNYDEGKVSFTELYKYVSTGAEPKENKEKHNTNTVNDTDTTYAENISEDVSENTSEIDNRTFNEEKEYVSGPTENIETDIEQVFEENNNTYNSKEETNSEEFNEPHISNDLENDISEDDNNTNEEIFNDTIEEKSADTHLPKLCIAQKYNNPAAIVKGYPVIIDNECYIIVDNAKTICLDDTKDKYSVNLFKVDKDTLKEA